MIPNLYIGNGCSTKKPFKTGCLGYQACKKQVLLTPPLEGPKILRAETPLQTTKWMFPKMGGKPPKWMVKIMENPMKMDDLEVYLFLETTKSQWNKTTEFKSYRLTCHDISKSTGFFAFGAHHQQMFVVGCVWVCFDTLNSNALGCLKMTKIAFAKQIWKGRNARSTSPCFNFFCGNFP